MKNEPIREENARLGREGPELRGERPGKRVAGAPGVAYQRRGPASGPGEFEALALRQALGVAHALGEVVATLVDYQFKAIVREAYPSKDALTAFLGTFYVLLWVGLVPATLFSLAVRLAAAEV